MITTVRRHDGFGCHMYWTMAGIQWSKIKNYDFSFTKLPVSYNNHKDSILDTGSMYEWEYQNVFGSEDMNRVNQLFSNIMNKNGYQTIERNIAGRNLGRKEHIKEIITWKKNKKISNFFSKELLTNFSNDYFSLTKKPKIYKNNKINIAIHIRRGDDLTGKTPRKKDHTHSSRWVSGKYYNAILEKLINIDNAVIHIFSQSDPLVDTKWKKYKNIVFHTEKFGSGKFYDHWEKMVYSDVLVLSPSVYSHSAGLFHKGDVIILRDSKKNLELSPDDWWENNKKYLKGL